MKDIRQKEREVEMIENEKREVMKVMECEKEIRQRVKEVGEVLERMVDGEGREGKKEKGKI